MLKQGRMKWAWARLLVPLEMEERKIRPYSNFNILDKENPCTIHLKKKIRPYFNSNVLDKENPCTFHLKFFLSIYLLVRYSLRTYRSKEILTPMLGFIESRYLCVINVFFVIQLLHHSFDIHFWDWDRTTSCTCASGFYYRSFSHSFAQVIMGHFRM